MPTPPDVSSLIAPEAFGLGWPTLSAARDLLAQLGLAGAALRVKLAGSSALAPYGRDHYSGAPTGLPQASVCPDPAGGPNGPGGVILHFTAGPTLASTVRWFCDPGMQSGRSAHLVIARTAEPALTASGAWVSACPDLRRLPALPVLCREPTTGAVAGAWTNAWAFHIELVSWGCAASDDISAQRGWPSVAGRRWQPYTAAQLATAAYIIRCLRMVVGTFHPARVWGHEHVQTVKTPGSEGVDKRDPGPLIPWAAMRQAVTAAGDIPVLQPDDPTVAAVLEGLGYGAGGRPGEGLRMAQYSLGLEVDGYAGPKTLAALAARVQDRLGLASGLTWSEVGRRLEALGSWPALALAATGAQHG